jgi:hypothetical protein
MTPLNALGLLTSLSDVNKPKKVSAPIRGTRP